MSALLVVALLAVVQSVFGVGLLLFGTPALLLLGLDFTHALGLLLPASLAISALQLAAADGPPTRRDGLDLLLWAVPALVAGLAWRLTQGAGPRIELLLAALLLLSAGLRHGGGLARTVQRLLARHQRLSLAGIGLVHGVTNMGGAALSAYAAMRHHDKARIRQCIALAYGLLAGSQLLVLLALRGPDDPLPSLVSPLVAAAAYTLFGRHAWQAIQQRPFQLALSGFMVACAALLVLRRFA